MECQICKVCLDGVGVRWVELIVRVNSSDNARGVKVIKCCPNCVANGVEPMKKLLSQ